MVARLALADILRAADRPSAVILDDALVNTDDGRLERMHLVLHKAAETLQVLVLSCRERDVLRLRFSEDLTQAEIGERVGVSQMHVSRIIRQAITRLREAASEA